MKTIHLALTLVFLMIVKSFGGWADIYDERKKDFGMDSTLVLPKQEWEKVITKAENGDSVEALKLYLHYRTLSDRIEEMFWLRTAADLRNPIAEYNMGILYTNEKYENLFKAKVWLQRAKADGVSMAGFELKRLEAREAAGGKGTPP
jgi:TPR repeat protein